MTAWYHSPLAHALAADCDSTPSQMRKTSPMSMGFSAALLVVHPVSLAVNAGFPGPSGEVDAILWETQQRLTGPGCQFGRGFRARGRLTA
jgi:hypothetical protein